MKTGYLQRLFSGKIFHRKIFLYTAIIILLSGWLYLLRFNTITAPFDRDEGEYAYSAWLLHDGGIPYKEAFMQKPPMIIYTYYLAQKISPDTWAPRILALGSLVLAALVLADILRREFGVATAVISMVLFPPLVSYPAFHGFVAQPEVFLILPLVASVWCYLGFRAGAELLWSVAMGACLAIAILYKPIVFPAAAFLTVYLFAVSARRAGWKCGLRDVSSLFLGVAAASVLILLPIIYLGGGPSMWDSAFRYNLYYAAAGDSGFLHARALLEWPIWALLAYFAIVPLKHRLFFLGLLLSLLAGTAGNLMDHYYLIIVPAVTAICAISIVDIGNRLSFDPMKRRRFFVFGTVLMVVLLVFPSRERFFLTPQQMSEWSFDDPAFTIAPRISELLQNITSKEDTVFIDASEPEILYYAHRKSVTRFVIKYPLRIPTPFTRQYQQELVSTLKANPPRAIVSPRTPLQVSRYRGKEGAQDDFQGEILGLLARRYEFVLAVSLEGENKLAVIDSAGELQRAHGYLSLYRRKD